MKVAAYIRVSTTEQTNGFGLDVQREKIQQWAELNDVSHIEWYEDAGFSGGSTSRPALERLLNEAGGYDATVVYKADRLSRSLRDLLVLIEDHLGAFVSVTEHFDTTIPQGKLLLQMIGGFAEFDRSMIRERMLEGQKAKARQGSFAAGKAAYGYDLKDGELVVNEEQMEVVRWILHSRKRASLRAIATELNKKGIPSPKGKNWTFQTVSYLLKNPKYRGVLRQRIGGEVFENSCVGVAPSI